MNKETTKQTTMAASPDKNDRAMKKAQKMRKAYDKLHSKKVRMTSSYILRAFLAVSALFTVAILVFLIGYILINGIPNLKPELFALEYTPDNVSMLPSIINTIFITLISLIAAVPVGIFSAIYLAEYAKKGSKIVSLIRLTTETLSGIPSIG